MNKLSIALTFSFTLVAPQVAMAKNPPIEGWYLDYCHELSRSPLGRRTRGAYFICVRNHSAKAQQLTDDKILGCSEDAVTYAQHLLQSGQRELPSHSDLIATCLNERYLLNNVAL